MKKIVYFLILGIFLISCSSDEAEVPDNNGGETDGDGGVEEVDNGEITLLTISRGANSNFSFRREIKELTIEAIITGEEGEVLSRSFIEADQEVVLKAKYTKEKKYDLHFVHRYIASDPEPDSNVNNVLSYFVQTFLNVSNRMYFFDLDKPQVSIEGKANLEFTNVPSNSIQTRVSNGMGSFGTSSAVVNGFVSLDIDVKSVGQTKVYVLGEIENFNPSKDVRYTTLDITNGDVVSLDYDNLPKASALAIMYPNLSVSDPGFKRYSTVFSGYNDFSDGYFSLDSGLLFSGDSLEEEFYLPENLFENYSFYTSMRFEDKIIYSRGLYKNVSEIPSTFTAPGLNASITNTSFLNYEATVTGEYDYFYIAGSYSNGSVDVPETKVFRWSIYDEKKPSISLDVKDLMGVFINGEDDFSFTVDDLNTQLNLFESSKINSKNDFIDVLIDRNHPNNLRTIDYVRWFSLNQGTKNYSKNNSSIHEEGILDYHLF